MNAHDVRELFTYNAWANRRIFDALGALPTDIYLRDVQSSFGSIHGTLVHIVGAEQVWLARWRGQASSGLLKGSEVASLAEARSIWDRVETERAAFLAGVTDALL